MRTYIAGPMRGKNRYNFDNFARIAKVLRQAGHEVISPAEIDIREGFDPDTPREITKEQYERYMERDFNIIHGCDAIYMLSGWEDSEGATREHACARAHQKIIYYEEEKSRDEYHLEKLKQDFIAAFKPKEEPMSCRCAPEDVVDECPGCRCPPDLGVPSAIGTPKPIDPMYLKYGMGGPIGRLGDIGPSSEPEPETILQEAQRLIYGDRNAQYGDPNQDFKRSADMLTGLFQYKLKEGEKFRPQDVSLIMILLKCSRAQHMDKRDNYVDIAGYAGCAQRCVDAQQKGDTRDKNGCPTESPSR